MTDKEEQCDIHSMQKGSDLDTAFSVTILSSIWCSVLPLNLERRYDWGCLKYSQFPISRDHLLKESRMGILLLLVLCGVCLWSLKLSKTMPNCFRAVILVWSIPMLPIHFSVLGIYLHLSYHQYEVSHLQRDNLSLGSGLVRQGLHCPRRAQLWWTA